MLPAKTSLPPLLTMMLLVVPPLSTLTVSFVSVSACAVPPEDTIRTSFAESVSVLTKAPPLVTVVPDKV